MPQVRTKIRHSKVTRLRLTWGIRVCRNYQLVSDAGIALTFRANPKDLFVDFQQGPIACGGSFSHPETSVLVLVDTNRTSPGACHVSKSLGNSLNIQIPRIRIFIDGVKEALLFTALPRLPSPQVGLITTNLV